MAARKSAKPADGEAAVVESKFSKEQLLSAKRFQGRKDIVNALLMMPASKATKGVRGDALWEYGFSRK